MEIKSQRPKEQDGVLHSLNAAIEVLNLARDLACVSSAAAAFASVSTLLTMVRVQFRVFCNDVFQIHQHLGLDYQ
jgi:hypothetical protein